MVEENKKLPVGRWLSFYVFSSSLLIVFY